MSIVAAVWVESVYTETFLSASQTNSTTNQSYIKYA